jgi:DNA polymerase gamma 1
MEIFNYGRIYGAGRSFAEKLLMQFNPNMPESQAREKAKLMYDSTKGKKIKKRKDAKKLTVFQNMNNNEYERELKWQGGTESEMFNKLEEIAKAELPKTPVLGACISKALEPRYVSDEVLIFFFLIASQLSIESLIFILSF